MRKVLIPTLATAALVSLILSLNATSAASLQVAPSPAAFLPHIVSEATATATLRPTPQPSNSLVISELSGQGDPEYMDIRNAGTGARDLTGWYIVSVIGGERFYFPEGYILDSAHLVQVESGTSALNNPPLQLLWSSGSIWSNSGDKAILYNSSDEIVHSACYGIGCAPGSTGATLDSQ